MHVMVARVLEKAFGGAVLTCVMKAIVQVDAERRGAVTRKPNFRVFAVRPLRVLRVLAFQQIRDSGMVPFELFVAVPSHHERSFPFVVAGHVLVDGQNEIEPATEEEVPVCADRIALQTPWLHSICSPTDAVVLSA